MGDGETRRRGDADTRDRRLCAQRPDLEGRSRAPTRTGRVLLIQAEWPARALLKAEMESRGHQVLGADSVPLALGLSTGRGFRPDVLVVDGLGLRADPADLERLRLLRGRASLLLVRSGQYASADTEALAADVELQRPVSVGEIADAVDRLVAGTP